MSRTLAAGLGLIALALLIGVAARLGLLGFLDAPLMHSLAMTRGYTPDWEIVAARAATALGDPAVRALFVIAGGAVLWLKRRRMAILVLFAGVAIGVSANTLLKEAFGRARPTLTPWLDNPDSFAFPSGHAANSMVVMVLPALLIGDRRVIWASLALAFVIGLSRPMLGVHWPSDVVGGWAFGGGVSLIALAIARRIETPALPVQTA